MPKRYFENPFNDLSPGGTVQVDLIVWKTRIQDLVDAIILNESSSRKCDGGLYVGMGGTAYMLWYVSTKMPDMKRLDKAKEIVDRHYKFCVEESHKDLGSRLGFFLGNTGVFAVKAVIANAMGDPQSVKFVQQFKNASDDFLQLDPLGIGSDELLVGRAGYIMGCLWLQGRLNHPILQETRIFKLCDMIVESGRRFSRKHSSKSPLMYQYYETQYLGAAHGLAGILQLLLSVPNYFKYNPDAEKDVKGAVDFLISLQNYEGNFPAAMGELKEPRHYSDELVHWCHGAPGTVYLLARAHSQWPQDGIYMDSLVKAANLTWKRGLLKKGPGLCHGVAGNGYVFLLMYRLTKNQLYLHRASKFADFLYSEQFKTARTPDCPISLFEGWAGTVCFLVDMLNPDRAAFPMMAP